MEEYMNDWQETNELKALCLEKQAKLLLPERLIKSKVMIVGEAPAQQEMATGKYFCGPSGQRLDQWLGRAKIIRALTYVTNVVKVQPRGNNIDNLPLSGLLIQNFYPLLEREIREVNPNIILALGNTALKVLTQMQGITNYRGSILPCTLVDGYKVLATYHPAHVLRVGPELNHICVFDIQKAVEASETKEIQTVPHKSIINPSFSETIAFLNKCKKEKYFSYDVETSNFRLTRIGIACNETEAISINFKTRNFSNCGTETELKFILEKIKEVWQTEGIVKIAQNSSFDLHYLVPLLGTPAGPLFDTLIAHKTLYSVGADCMSAFPHDLGFLTSTCTDMPYHKEDVKFVSTPQMPNQEKEDKLSLYNCKDVISTLRTAITLMKELKERGMLEQFIGCRMMSQRIFFEMELIGLGTDKDKLREMREEVKQESRLLQAEIDAEAKLVGRETLNVNSSNQVANYLYQDLGLKTQTKRGTDTVTTDTKALTALFARTQNKVLKKILRQRTLLSKYLGNYLNENKLAKDGRLRTSFGQTASGRTSSKKNIALGCGNNLQNIPGESRHFVVPDDGKVFLCPDLSQAEALVVVYCAKAEELKQRMVAGEKIHSIVGEWLFNKPKEELTSAEYKQAKIIVHSSNYMVGINTLAVNMGVKVSEAKKLQTKYAKVFPELARWQDTVISNGIRERKITSVFGYERLFLGFISTMTQNEMVSHIPQSTVATILNLGMNGLYLVKPKEVRIVLPIHDELVLELPESLIEEFSPYIKYHMETLRSVEIEGDVLTIPVDIGSPSTHWKKG